jgi:5-enolpyruvylshikimate-3-phosphate synthase
MVAQKAVTIDDASVIETSFPGFRETMTGLGGRLSAPAELAPE